MKYLVAATLVCLIPALGLSRSAAAHFPATSGNIESEMHMEPDDSIIAGRSETIYFILSDTSGRFKMANCVCDLTISQGDQAVYHASVLPAKLPSVYSSAGIPFNFSGGNYHFNLAAQPKIKEQFNPFQLNWSLNSTQQSRDEGLDWAIVS